MAWGVSDSSGSDFGASFFGSAGDSGLDLCVCFGFASPRYGVSAEPYESLAGVLVLDGRRVTRGVWLCVEDAIFRIPAAFGVGKALSCPLFGSTVS